MSFWGQRTEQIEYVVDSQIITIGMLSLSLWRGFRVMVFNATFNNI